MQFTECSGFQQVQLLVSESDVENYKQIKADLDELRLLVEKSELWVFKEKGDKKKKKEAEGEENVKDDDEVISYCVSAAVYKSLAMQICFALLNRLADIMIYRFYGNELD